MSKVIKKTDAGNMQVPLSTPTVPTSSSRKGVIDKDVYEAKSQAQVIIEEAQQQAQAIIAQAQSQANQVLEQSKQEGFNKGQEEASTEVAEFIAKQTEHFEQVLQKIEPQVVELTMSIVKKVLGDEIEANPQVIVNVTKNALKTVRQRREITLRANPEDITMLQESKRQLLDVLLRTKDIMFEEDPAIQRGGVIIETEAGRIDARLETQLAVFEKIFLGP